MAIIERKAYEVVLEQFADGVFVQIRGLDGTAMVDRYVNLSVQKSQRTQAIELLLESLRYDMNR